eukprot:jgi/Psemu1/43841/gm1.43841_g
MTQGTTVIKGDEESLTTIDRDVLYTKKVTSAASKAALLWCSIVNKHKHGSFQSELEQGFSDVVVGPFQECPYNQVIIDLLAQAMRKTLACNRYRGFLAGSNKKARGLLVAVAVAPLVNFSKIRPIHW